jgi:hypothetical protein
MLKLGKKYGYSATESESRGGFAFFRKIRRNWGKGTAWLAVALIVSLISFVPGVPVKAANCTMTEDGNGDLIIAASCTIPAGTYNITRDFVVNSGVTVTAGGNTGSNTGVVINAGRDIDIQGIFSATSQGYGHEAGPGAGNNDGSDHYSGSGGSHGGRGGYGGSTPPISTYGDVSAPLTLGSGGGGDSNNCGGGGGGTGGGAIKLAATGTVSVSGEVRANGGYPTCADAGAGSAGSIWFDAATIAGSGIVTANGSNSRTNECGGAGGGGRIAFTYTGSDTSSYTLQAYGGNEGGQCSNGDAGAGTIFKKGPSSTYGDLIVDNATREDRRETELVGTGVQTYDNITVQNAANLTVPSGLELVLDTGGTWTIGGTGSYIPEITVWAGGTFTPNKSTLPGLLHWDIRGTVNDITALDLDGSNFYDSYANMASWPDGLDVNIANGVMYTYSAGTSDIEDIVIESGGTLQQQAVGTITFANITVESGGNVNHRDNSTSKLYEVNLKTTGDFDLQSGATVNVNGLGYDAATGTCAGNTGQYGNPACHGGRGGNNIGTPYGSIRYPVTMGSGASDSGGGVVKLEADGTLTVNGNITADGNGAGYYQAAAAGGSIWLDAATLAGTGLVRAKGGQSYNSLTRNGGGGRVAVYYDVDSSTLISGDKLQAHGGTNGGRDGGAGTVFIKDNAAANGDLLIDNNNNTGAWTYIVDDDDASPSTHDFDNLIVRDGGNLLVLAGYTVTVPTSGTISGGGSDQPLLQIASGATLNPPTTGVWSLTGLSLYNYGTVNNVTDLTLNDSAWIHGGTFGATVTDITLENGGGMYYTTANTFSPTNVTVQSGGHWESRMVGTVNVTNMTIESGGNATHESNAGSKAYELNLSLTNLDVQSGGTVNANGVGYGEASGTCAGSTSQYGNGACHAGRASYNVGTTYGDLREPTALGSGASNGGGGAVKLVVSDTLTVNGNITADGVTGNYYEAGSAGGSIWLDTATLAGAGLVRAKGGNAYNSLTRDGGGGRVAVYYTTDASTLISGDKLQAHGGQASSNRAGAGTVFFDDKDDSLLNGSLIVDNQGNTNSAYTPQLSASQTFDYVRIYDGGEWQIGSGETLTIPTTGTFVGGGGSQPLLRLESGGTWNVPTTGTYTFQGIDVSNAGTINNLVDLTLNDSIFSHAGEDLSALTDLTIGNAGYFRLYAGGADDFNPTNVTVKSGGYWDAYMTDTAATMTNFTAESGATVRHATNSTSKAYEVYISATDIDIQSGATVNVSGRGYDGGDKGPGASVSGDSGAGYGGNGGNGNGTGGNTYGSAKQPTDLGSGGNGGICDGGGAVRLVASGTLTVNGTINADAYTCTSASDNGAGSGGSVWLDSATLAGAGTVSANGSSAYTGWTYGGGAGGRIAIYYNTDSSTIISGNKVNAYGGAKGYGSSTAGGAGTIFLDDKDDSRPNGTLISDGNNRSSIANTTHTAGVTETYDQLILRDGTKYRIPSGTQVTVASGGSITEGGGNATSIVINSGGTLYLPTAGVDGVDLTNNGTIGSSATSFSNDNATWTNNATVAGVTDFTCAGGTCENNGVFEGGLTNLTVESGGNYIQTSTLPLFSGSDLVIENGGTFTQNHTETIEVGLLRVETGGTLTHADNSGSKLAEIDISATTVEIQSGAFVDANVKGFDAATGDGAGTTVGGTGGGAGHAVAGGEGTVSGTGQSNGGAAYGSETAPTTMGSGGGTDGGSAGGAGGGVVKIIASGTMTIEGTIRANGGAGAGAQAGGGSGGSIWLEADTWAGTTGVVSADGGAGAGTSTDGGGCGSGGRVRFFYGTKTYTGTITADNGCDAPDLRAPSATPSVVEAADAPSFTQFTVTPAVPYTHESALVETTATFATGVDKIEIYLDGTDPGDLIHTCDPAGTSDPLSCDYSLDSLSRGSHTVTAIAYGPLAQEGSQADTFTVAAITTLNSISLSSLKAGDTAVDFELSFFLNGSSTGTLTVELPSFTVTDDTATGSSSCLTGITAEDSDTITASKVDCSGTVTLTGIQLTNPGSAGSYTITWSNDSGSATVFIVDDDAVSVTGNIDPTLTFDLDVSVIDADSDDPYAVDLGTLSTSGPSGSNNGAIPSIWIDLSTNATGGATVTVSSLYQALRSASNPSDEIASGTATLTGGTEGYGICVASATGTQDGGDSFTAQGNYAGTCTAGSYDVGALPADAAPASLLVADGPISAGRSQVRVGASMSTATPAHPDYTDVLTFLATGTF